jgi:hypothetical protein
MSEGFRWSFAELERARGVLAVVDQRFFKLDQTLDEPTQVKQAIEYAVALTSGLANEMEWRMHCHGLK